MEKTLWNKAWLKQLAVAVGYALVYEAEHPFSHTQFPLDSVLRLIVLLFLPYRYWAAVAVGEFLPNFRVVYPCLDQFGPAWVALRTIPPIVLGMPIVWWCRTRLALFPSKHLVNITALLICVFASSLAWTAYSFLAVVAAHVKPGTLAPTPTIALSFFIGKYFAMLALVPWALIARFEHGKGGWRDIVQRALKSPLLREGMTVMLPSTGLLALYSQHVDQPQFMWMATILPVAWLTLRFGWRGTALSGTLAILCVVSVLPSEAYKPNVDVIQIELFLACTITILYALGALISAYVMHVMHTNEHLRHAESVRQLARESYHKGEYQQQQTAEALEFMAGSLHLISIRWLQYLGYIDPDVKTENYFFHAINAHKQLSRLAERLHPIAWRDRGLPAALQQTVGRAVNESGIDYHCEIKGRGFWRIRPTVLAATYRAACEAIVYVSAAMTCSRINLTLRGGETHGTRWLFVSVEGLLDDTAVARAIYHATARQHMAAKLGTHGYDLSELRDHVRLFDGELHDRSDRQQHRMRITMLLQDVQRTSRKEPTFAPMRMRLWVQ